MIGVQKEHTRETATEDKGEHEPRSIPRIQEQAGLCMRRNFVKRAENESKNQRDKECIRDGANKQTNAQTRMGVCVNSVMCAVVSTACLMNKLLKRSCCGTNPLA